MSVWWSQKDPTSSLGTEPGPFNCAVTALTTMPLCCPLKNPAKMATIYCNSDYFTFRNLFPSYGRRNLKFKFLILIKYDEILMMVHLFIHTLTPGCWCDPVGSVQMKTHGIPSWCHPRSGRCHCKPGVSGTNCNRCLSGHWDFGLNGCRPCACPLTCDPITGHCLGRSDLEFIKPSFIFIFLWDCLCDYWCIRAFRTCFTNITKRQKERVIFRHKNGSWKMFWFPSMTGSLRHDLLIIHKKKG